MNDGTTNDYLNRAKAVKDFDDATATLEQWQELAAVAMETIGRQSAIINRLMSEMKSQSNNLSSVADRQAEHQRNAPILIARDGQDRLMIHKSLSTVDAALLLEAALPEIHGVIDARPDRKMFF